MIIYMKIKLDKKRDIAPSPFSLSINVDGTDYLFTWDETDVWSSTDDNVILYRLKGASIENSETPERYANGLLNQSSVCRLNEVTWNEDSGEEFDESILNLELKDDNISVYCKLDHSTSHEEVPEIHMMLVLSTAHITKETADMLTADEIDDIVVFPKSGYGWFVTDWDLDNVFLPNSLRACLKYAEKNGCDWLCFDCDGPIVDGLPVYHW